MSPFSRTNKPLEPKDFIHPRTLPPRANPRSEEARSFGPFSKRREVNIRWRFYRNELKKVLPPLEITMNEESPFDNNVLPPLGTQRHNLMDELERIVGGELRPEPPLTRREKRQKHGIKITGPSARAERHTSRWLRRRYRSLLSTIPQLAYQPSPKGGSKIIVNKHPLGHHPHDRDSKSMPVADAIQVAWIEQTGPEDTEPKAKSKNDRRKG